MPTNYTGSQRKLTFPLQFALANTSDTPQSPEIINHPFEWSTTDSDERVNILLNLSLNEYIALSSCIHVGSDIAYGEDAILIWWTWVRSVISTDPSAELSPESGDCYAYPLYAPFISYSPINPFNEPNEIPTGWLSPPFTIYDGGGSLPPDYLENDIIVPYSAITLDPFDIFGGQLPTIQIAVTGSGQIELDLLAIGLGGLVAVSFNQAPSLLDILSGTFSPDTTVIDTNLDASLPSEDDVVIQHEIDITEAAGVETIVFLTFMPVIDDSVFLPLRFGGGIRSVQLCGFESAGVIMGITDIRINNCEIEKFENGVWSSIVGSLQSCIDTAINPLEASIVSLQNTDVSLQSQINANDNDILALQTAKTDLQNQITANDGDIADIILSISGLNAIDISLQNQITANDDDIAAIQSTNDLQDAEIDSLNTYANDHENRLDVLEAASGGSGSQATKFTSLTYFVSAEIPTTIADTWELGIPTTHQFTYPNALIIAEIKSYSAGATPITKFRIKVDTTDGTHEAWTQETHVQSVQVNDNFTGIDTTQPVNLQLWFKTSSVNTSGRISANQYVQFAIFEFGDPLPTSGTHNVTFDASGDAYTLDAANVGTVQTGGNPDNCLKGVNVQLSEDVGIDIIFAEERIIDAVSFDFFTSDDTNTDLQIRIYDESEVLQHTETYNTSPQSPNNWFTYTSPSGSYPVVGKRVNVRAMPVNTAVSDIRIDNILVDWS